MIFGETQFVQSPRLPDRLVTTNGVKVAARYLEHVSPEPTCSFSRPKTIHHPMKTSSLGQGCQVPRTFIKEKTLLSWGFHRSKQVFIELRSPSTKLDTDKALNVVQRREAISKWTWWLLYYIVSVVQYFEPHLTPKPWETFVHPSTALFLIWFEIWDN